MSRLADSPGVYKGFSGKIEYKSIYCEVRNASFEILRTKKRFKDRCDIWIEFKSGDVVSGILKYTNIESCSFYGGLLVDSVFRDGVFDGGKFENSYWYDGTWIGGDWGYNYDKFGRTCRTPPTMWGNIIPQVSGVANKKGRYEDFSGRIKWQGCDLQVKNAFFELNEPHGYDVKTMIIHSGTVLSGVAIDILVDYCVWESGILKSGNSGYKTRWLNGVFTGGTWEYGFWRDGIFDGGTWVDGLWQKGVWEGDYDKNIVWHGKNDSPDKWNI